MEANAAPAVRLQGELPSQMAASRTMVQWLWSLSGVSRALVGLGCALLLLVVAVNPSNALILPLVLLPPVCRFPCMVGAQFGARAGRLFLLPCITGRAADSCRQVTCIAQQPRARAESWAMRIALPNICRQLSPRQYPAFLSCRH
jgi:hypothetical protein